MRFRLPSQHEIRTRLPLWVRIPLGVLLMIGGMLGFLPVLGFWMFPLGIVVIFADTPLVERHWERFRHWVHAKLPADPPPTEASGAGAHGTAEGERDHAGSGPRDDAGPSRLGA